MGRKQEEVCTYLQRGLYNVVKLKKSPSKGIFCVIIQGMNKLYDVLIIGGGASGLAAAAAATGNGKAVIVLDSSTPIARKVLASGGGRCNFTNLAVSVDKYFGQNRDFVRSAISKVSPALILKWAANHQIKYVEKAPGQYFCKNSSQDIVNALLYDARNAKILKNEPAISVTKEDNCFKVKTPNGSLASKSVIVATGGISFPVLNVSDFGYKIAKQFGHKIIPVRPALCAIATDYFSSELSGISVNAEITVGKEKINDAMLFTHFGIGGPAVYKATVRDFNDIKIDLTPGINIYELLRESKKHSGKKTVAGILSNYIPIRLAKWLCNDQKNIADYKDTDLKAIADKVNNIILGKNNIKLHSIQSAEVVRGGVDTSQVSSKTMESKLCPGLFFAGEVLDISGDLGGFNLHWAWASGHIAGENA